jgi:hypothetical protein
VPMKKIILITFCLMTYFNAYAQMSNEEISKALKSSSSNVEEAVNGVVIGMNKSKGKMTDEITLSLGATSNSRVITASYQLPNHELNAEQVAKVREGVSANMKKLGCSNPLIVILLKEHSLKINFRYFDKNMKQLTEFGIDAKSCN